MKLPTNTIRFDISISQDTDVVEVDVHHNLSRTMDSSQRAFYTNVVNGLYSKLKTEIETFHNHGVLLAENMLLREIIDNELEEEGVMFEPDDELIEAIEEAKSEGKVLDFKKKLH